MIHELKITPKYFESIHKEGKLFEVRKDDRPYELGDFLALNEYDNGEYTGKCLMVEVTYILKDPKYCKPGYCILGIIGCLIHRRTEHGFIEERIQEIPVYGKTKKQNLSTGG